MTGRFLRFLRNNAVAMLALFLALGGTTYAASTSLIGRNTVASPQVVNGSLQTKDLSRKARKALKGNRGPRGLRGLQGSKGPSGAKGATGAQGPSGPGRSDIPLTPCDPGPDNAYDTCATVNLTLTTAGRVLLIASSGWETTTAPSSGRCRFTGSGTSNHQVAAGETTDTTAADKYNFIAFNEVTNPVSAGTHTFTFECRELQAATNSISFTGTMLSAVYVGGA